MTKLVTNNIEVSFNTKVGVSLNDGTNTRVARRLTSPEFTKMRAEVKAISTQHGGRYIETKQSANGDRSFVFSMPYTNQDAFKQAIQGIPQKRPLSPAKKLSPTVTSWPNLVVNS